MTEPIVDLEEAISIAQDYKELYDAETPEERLVDVFDQRDVLEAHAALLGTLYAPGMNDDNRVFIAHLIDVLELVCDQVGFKL